MADQKRTVVPALKLHAQIDQAKSSAVAAIEAAGPSGPHWPHHHHLTLERIELAATELIESLARSTRCPRRKAC